jgi:hypothetical protein
MAEVAEVGTHEIQSCIACLEKPESTATISVPAWHIKSLAKFLASKSRTLGRARRPQGRLGGVGVRRLVLALDENSLTAIRDPNFR